jgi:chorismate mutase
LLLSLCLLLPIACDRRPAAPSTAIRTDTAALDVLLRRIQQRLDLMHAVARVKWKTQAPIRDPQREQALLDDMVEGGRANQMDAEFARAFFAAQIEAAKLVQDEDSVSVREAAMRPFRR